MATEVIIATKNFIYFKNRKSLFINSDNIKKTKAYRDQTNTKSKSLDTAFISITIKCNLHLFYNQYDLYVLINDIFEKFLFTAL